MLSIDFLNELGNNIDNGEITDEEILEGLNDEQKNAVVETINDDSLVLAGAGAGKSRVLISRVQYLLNQGVDPSQIMAITFTKKSADELVERVSLVCDDIGQMTIGTYHSVALKILKEFGEYINLKDFTIGEEIKTSRAKEILEDLDIPTDKKNVKAFLDKISKLKNNLVVPKKFRESTMAKYNGNEEEYEKDSMYNYINFYSKYQTKNSEESVIDFDDMIMYCVFIMECYPTVLKELQDRYKYILIDEVQDSNLANIRFIKLISENSNLFMVGDIDQAIYGFRSARPEYFKYIANEDKIKVLRLKRNYRSTQTIVNASNSLVDKNKDRIEKTCFSQNEVGSKIQYRRFTNNILEAEYICDEINNLVSEGNNYSDIMIITRVKYIMDLIEQELMKKKIPTIVIGKTSFTQRKEIKDCLCFLRLYANKKDKYSFKRALGLLKGLGKTAITEILDIFDGNRDAVRTLKEYVPKTTIARESIEFLMDLLLLVDEKPVSFLSRIVYLVLDIVYKDNPIQNEEDKKKLTEKVDRVNSLLTIATSKEEKGITRVSEFIEELDMLSKSDFGSNANAVKIITVHSSKGLECKNVIIAGVNKGIFPHFKAKKARDIEEERRCMYVAMTRAKSKLFITSYKSDATKENSCPYEESRFINEIPDKYLERHY